MFDRAEPELFGWPFFYRAQRAFVVVGVGPTSLVYCAHQRRKQG